MLILLLVECSLAGNGRLMLEIEHNLSMDLSKVRPFLFLGFVDTMEFFVMKGIKAESFFGSIVHRRYSDFRVEDAGVDVRLSPHLDSRIQGYFLKERVIVDYKRRSHGQTCIQVQDFFNKFDT